jgi:hypothetical protein
MAGGGRRWKTLVSPVEGIAARHRVSHRRPPPLEIVKSAISAFPQRRRCPGHFSFHPRARPCGAPCQISGPWEDKRRESCHVVRLGEKRNRCSSTRDSFAVERPRFIHRGEQRFNYRLRPFSMACNGSLASSTTGQALHVLDRFHIASHLNQAVDQVRRAETTRLRSQSKGAAARRGSRVRGRARQKLNALLAGKPATARAWELKVRLLALPGHATAPRTDERSSPDAARGILPRAAR